MTFPKGYHCTTLKENNIKPFYVKKEWFNIGVTECLTTFGRKVSCYNKERTICDIGRLKVFIMNNIWYIYKQDTGIYDVVGDVII